MRAEAAPGRVLLVEDNRVNRLLLQRQVTQLGHRVEAVENGRLALELLKREPFDLLLLDIEMPELDGFALLELLLADPELRGLPVIVTSALDGIAHVVRCIELGAEDYLAKPVNPVLLRARIGASLEKKRLRDEQREWVRRFATPQVAQDLERSGFALGGRHVQAAVLFCDLRDFTDLVERCPPEETIELLNGYYLLAFDAIQGRGGVVNQMIGDGLMAVFGAPQPLADHGRCAVDAALELVAMLGEYSRELVAAARPALRVGVGIASGAVVAGYTGTPERATYTCIGSTVNRAARLEAQTKTLQRDIVVDAATRDALDGGGLDLRIEALGALALKGLTEPVEAFAIGT